MNRILLSTVALSFIALAACSKTAEEGTTEAAAFTGNEPAAATADGTYKASCSNKFGSIELSASIEKGVVTKLSGSADGRNGKLRVGNQVQFWESKLSGNVTRIDNLPNRAVIEGEGKVEYTVDTKTLEKDEETVTTLASCESPGTFPSFEIVAHSGDGHFRGITLHHVKITKAACMAEDGPLDDVGDWSVDCDEDDATADGDSLAAFVTALAGAKPAK